MDRGGEHPQRHLANYAELLQADAYGGYGQLYAADRVPGPILEAACWAGSSFVESPDDDHARHSMPFSRGRPPHQFQ